MRGDVDGFILSDGTEVHLPPHLGSQIVFVARPGDTVTIRGLNAQALPLVDAASVMNFVSGAIVTDDGPPDGPGGGANEWTVSSRSCRRCIGSAAR